MHHSVPRLTTWPHTTMTKVWPKDALSSTCGVQRQGSLWRCADTESPGVPQMNILRPFPISLADDFLIICWSNIPSWYYQLPFDLMLLTLPVWVNYVCTSSKPHDILDHFWTRDDLFVGWWTIPALLTFAHNLQPFVEAFYLITTLHYWRRVHFG